MWIRIGRTFDPAIVLFSMSLPGPLVRLARRGPRACTRRRPALLLAPLPGPPRTSCVSSQEPSTDQGMKEEFSNSTLADGLQKQFPLVLSGTRLQSGTNMCTNGIWS